ncbi:MAG: sulfatase-like hydrolase/transferase [Thiolinea sp.]
MKRNMLIIMNDEHARDGISCYGGVARTPNIDKLAAQGTCFTQAYTPSPICVPARAAFQSGQYVYQNRCWSNAQPYSGKPEGWGHRLQEAGYESVSIGKLHYRGNEDNNGFNEELEPLYVRNGEGWVYGILRRQDHTPYNTTSFAEHIGPGEDDYSEYDRRVRDRAVQWLKTNAKSSSDQPWVLFVSFLRPHYPLTCPKPWFDLYDPKHIPPPRFAGYQTEFRHPVLNAFRSYYSYDDHFSPEQKQIARASYFGLCSFVDDLIGDVLGALEDSGQMHDTSILFTADHGELNGHHGLWTKMTMQEDSVGIPMILAGAGAPTGLCQTQTSLIDVHQTVLEATGLEATEADQALSGQSLFQTAARADDPQRAVLSEYHDGGSITGFMMLREGRWKYIAYPGFAPQLFDLQHDPHEINDLGLTAEHAPVREHLHQRMCNEFADPETINQMAFSDQEQRIAELGGIDSIYQRDNYDHTPVSSTA